MGNGVPNSDVLPKACLFNLIVFCEAEQCSLFLRTYIDQLVEIPLPSHQCRSVPDSSLQDITLDGLSKNEDRLFIRAPQSKVSSVPSLILPYLVPDLPVYLLWGQDPTTETQILPSALKYGSRLIFDSSAPENLQEFAKKLYDLQEKNSIGLVDLKLGAFGQLEKYPRQHL